MENYVLLQGDADAIKSYVFEASGLPQIRGGSQKLVECEKKVEKYVKEQGGETIYCSGGGFLFKVPSDKAEKIRKAIERIYLDETQVATVTVVYEDSPLPPPPTPRIPDGWAGRLVKASQEVHQAGEFAQRTAFLAARLRQAKAQKATFPFIESFPFGKRCDICGKRVAEYELEYTENDETKGLCQVCYQRHSTGLKVRNKAFQDFAEERELPLKAKPAQDIDHLVKSAHRTYVAFLYADGNNIGSLLQKVKSEEEFKALSESLGKETQRALFETLWEVCSNALNQEEVWPFEILNIGGDDVTLLIQPGYVWETAISFLEKFQNYIREGVKKRLGYWPTSWPETLTASVGIAIADAKHPMRYLEALASDLLKRAKKTAREAHTSAIDFLWLPNATAVTQAEMVADVYRRGDLILTARPYTLAQAKIMQDMVSVLSEWPRSLRHRWGEALDRGRWASLGLMLYDLARWKGRENQAQKVDKLLNALNRLAKAFREQTEVPMGYLWWEHREDGRLTWRTALLDALELAELRAMRPDIQPDIQEEDE